MPFMCLGETGVALGSTDSPSRQPSGLFPDSPPKGRLDGGGGESHRSKSHLLDSAIDTQPMVGR